MPDDADRRILVGRDAELARLHALVEAARAGRGGALRIEGAPGVGKSALLAAAAPRDLTCLTATGVETEIELPFAGLEELLAGLPAASGGRAGLDADHDPAGRLRDVAARLAAARPLVVLVDDVQWLDPSSRTAVAYLARRARRLGIGVVAVWSLRGPAPDELAGGAVARTRRAARGDAVRLARERGLAAPVAEALVGAVGGNPLALVEAPEELSTAQRAGRAMLPDPLPVGERLQRAYAARIAALPGPAGAALLLAAAGAPPALVADALGPAEDAGLVRLGDGPAAGVAFTHPLVRSAVYHAAAPTARRDAHRAIAAAVEEPERSWQLALAAAAPDEALAARLEALAEEARAAAARRAPPPPCSSAPRG